MNGKVRYRLLLLAVVLMLSACGGGGSSHSGGEVPAPPVVVNNAPVANAGLDQQVLTGTVVTLDGSGSSDPDGNVLTFAWTITQKPAGSTVTDANLSNPATPRPAFTPDVAGQYLLQLTVSDGSLTATDIVGVTGTIATAPTAAVSVATGGAAGNGNSYFAAISADGRYLAFVSQADNLVPGDTNGVSDIFVHDRQSGSTGRVSVASDVSQANAASLYPAISADGRYVAFASDASNLVAGDTNGVRDVFVHDRQTGSTERVSIATGGAEGNGDSYYPAISDDGRFVAFDSDAFNLVAGDSNASPDIFVRDRQNGSTVRVSVAADGTQGNGASNFASLSAEGRFVAFHSNASNLVAGDTNASPDIFVRDQQTGSTERVSVGSGGNEANGDNYSPVISGDGRYVAFHSFASNLVASDVNGWPDVFVRDRQTGSTLMVSRNATGTQGNFGSYDPALSASGRFVAFHSDADNLVPGDTNAHRDVFVQEVATGRTARVSLAADGTQANNDSFSPALNADGRHVAFESAATLTAGDVVFTDIFVAPNPLVE